MTDKPEGFEGYICDKYKMNPVTFKLLYEYKYNSDLAAYTAGMAQGRRGQAEKDAITERLSTLAVKWVDAGHHDWPEIKALLVKIDKIGTIRDAAGEQ